MATKVFQRGNFVIVEQSAKENPIPIDNFDYDFVTPNSVKLKDVVESIELNAATVDLQKQDGTPISTEALAKDHFATFIKSSMGDGGGGPSGTPQPSRLVNPSSVAFTGFKSLSFLCDGANDSITVTQGGNSVTYPHANSDGSLVRGYEIPFNSVAYSNSITFNGTGTVELLKID